MDSDYYSLTQTSTVETTTDALAGTVQKIHVKNFMCHDNLEVTLNPRINFICGKNGSGKSAIQTAIAVGLGGRALATNRGSSLKALIKNDRSTASVSITVNNEGPLAYEPKIYGQLIIIERIFSHSSGSYKIKNCLGKQISNEKREIDSIVQHFNIQVDNPICILHQDTARNFLNSSDPKNKYKFFMKASRFDEISRLYDESQLLVITMKESVTVKFEVANESFADVLEMAKKLKNLEDARSKEAERLQLENELVWAKINEDNTKLDGICKEKEAELKSKRKFENTLEGLVNSDLDKNIRELQEQIRAMDEEAGDVRERIGPARNEVARKTERYERLKERLKEAQQAVKRDQQKYNSCMEEINKEAPNAKEQQDKLKQQKAEGEKNLESIMAALESFQRDKQQLADTMAQVRGSLNDLEDQIRQKRHQQGKRQQQRERLGNERNALSIYGNIIEQIVEEVNSAAAQRKFKRKPIGPIGLYIKARDANWAGPIENFLGKGMLSSFCVDNGADSNTLRNIFRKVCGRNPQASAPPIICSKFLESVHDIRRNEVTHPQFRSLAAALEITHPVVTNCLIDQQEIESVLLIPTNEQAYQLLDTAHKVPRNCRRAFTSTGDQFFPAPNYKSYSSPKSVEHATLLQTNQEAIIRKLDMEIRQLGTEIHEVEAEKKNIQMQVRDTTDALKNNEDELNNLRKQKFNLERRIRELKANIELDQGANVDYLEGERVEITRKLENTKNKYQELMSDYERQKQEVQEALESYDQLKKTLGEIEQKKAPIKDEIERLQSLKQQSQHRTEILKKRIREYNDKIIELDSQIAVLSEKVDQNTENASQMCEPVNTQRSLEEIHRDLKKVVAYLNKIKEKNGGTLTEIEGNFKEKQRAFNTVNKNLQKLRTLLHKTAQSIYERKQKEERLHWSASVSAKHNFVSLLNERNFDGKLEFDFEKRTLEIKVKPLHEEGQSSKKHDTASLSGGEKSFSTVCFIMALWQEIELPFHFLDEFDVFMDGINRRIVMDMLISYAKKINQQFVLLTPLDMSSIPPSDDISIHRMAAPRQ